MYSKYPIRYYGAPVISSCEPIKNQILLSLISFCMLHGAVSCFDKGNCVIYSYMSANEVFNATNLILAIRHVLEYILQHVLRHMNLNIRHILEYML